MGNDLQALVQHLNIQIAIERSKRAGKQGARSKAGFFPDAFHIHQGRKASHSIRGGVLKQQ
jgi:hypothetical protein